MCSSDLIGAGEIVALEIRAGQIAARTIAGAAGEKISTLIGPRGRERQHQGRKHANGEWSGRAH